MSRTTKKSTAPQLPQLEPSQRRTLELQPFAEKLAERVMLTLCSLGDPFTIDDAIDAMYSHMMATSHRPGPDDRKDDEIVGIRMCAHQDAGMMVGFALGKLVGGAR